jgi:hypothetical protein
MSKPIHTPGPIQYCGCGKCGYIHSQRAGRDVAVAMLAPPCGGSADAEDRFWESESYPVEERNANARLLAAAYNAFDSAAAKLGVNAVELAERMADGGIAELVEALIGIIRCFENVPQEASMGFDSPPEPASEWDMNAFIELQNARALIAKVKGGAT